MATAQKTAIRRQVAQVFNAYVQDLDTERDLTPAFRRKLLRSMDDKKAGRVTSLDVILKKYAR